MLGWVQERVRPKRACEGLSRANNAGTEAGAGERRQADKTYRAASHRA